MLLHSVLTAACLALTGAAPPEAMTLFDPAEDAAVEGQGATGRVEDTDDGRALRIEFGHDGQWPGLRVNAPEGGWDLSQFDRVEADLTNPGEAEVRVLVRVDNPGADGQKHCNTEPRTLPPGETATVTVVFGRSWGGAGFPIDPSNVTGVLIFLDRPTQDHALLLHGIRAGGALADLPDWLGERPPVPGDWEPTLSEEFDGEELDEDLWNTKLVWDGPLERDLQVYLPENVSVSDGLARMKFEKRAAHQYGDPALPTRDYATACLTTQSKFTQRYGYFEARVKFPTARGGWPAFWMIPDRGLNSGDIWERRSTHDGGMEIDIAEYLSEWGPGIYNIAAHWDGYGDEHQSTSLPHPTFGRTADGFHAFGLLWEPGRLTRFADGEQVGVWEDERVCSVPEMLKFTIQVGGYWATHDVDDGALPDYFLIDYVRAWQRGDLAKLNEADGQEELRPEGTAAGE